MHLRFDFPSTCRIAFVAATLVMSPAAAGSAWAQEQGQVFVANYFGDAVTMWPLPTTGNVAPASTILLPPGASPHQIAINHRAGELIVANNVLYSVAVFDRATGTLKRTIAGLSTGINRPTGVAIDETRAEIYVANDFGHSITVYDELATGDAAPIRTITSWALFAPVGLAVDIVNDEILVADYGNHAILTFARSADGPVDPKRQIRGAGLSLPQGIALDLMHDEILVANSSFDAPDAGSVLAFNRSDDGVLAAPLRRLEGSATKLCNPFSVAIDYVKDQIVVANANFGGGSCTHAVTTYGRTATGNVAPARTIAGSSTTLNYPTSAAVFYGGSLSVSNKPSSGNVAAGGLVTYNIMATAVGGTVLGANLADTLPVGLTWGLGGTDAGACTLVGNQLNCSFGNLAKGQSKSIKVSATSPLGNCSPISNQATASYNNGEAFLTAASSAATVNIKCK
jgi:DNA-binding beta-propeller fold protein YncE